MRQSSLLTLHSGLFSCLLHIFSWNLAAGFLENRVWGLWHGHISIVWDGQHIATVATVRRRNKKSCAECKDLTELLPRLFKQNKRSKQKRKAREKYWFSKGRLENFSKPSLCSVSLVLLQALVMAKASKQCSRGRSQLECMSRGKGACWASVDTKETLRVQIVPCNCYCMWQKNGLFEGIVPILEDKPA